MMSRSSELAAAVLATLMLVVGFVAGTFFAASGSVTPTFADPDESARRSSFEPPPEARSSEQPERRTARVSSPVHADYRVSDAELARATRGIDVTPRPATRGAERVTGLAATMLGEPLEGVVVVATLRSASNPYGEFSDALGQADPIDATLDDTLTQRAEAWARSRGSRYRGVTEANGRYTIDGLPEGRFRLSAYKAGYVLEPVGNSSYVDAGDTRDFSARPVIEFTANIRLPDGSEPPIALIRVTRGRRTSSMRWTPDRRTIRLPAADGSAVALTGFVTGPGYATRAPARFQSAVVRLSDEQRTLDFQLAPQVGIYGRILDPAGIRSFGQVALLDLSRDPTVSEAAFATRSTRASTSSNAFEFLGLAPGPYAIGLLGRREDLLASATVTVSDGLVEQHLELARPNPEDSIRVLCLSPAGTPLHDVEFRFRIYSDNGTNSGSVSRPTRDSDGAYLLPRSALGDFETRAEPALLRITAAHPAFGRCTSDLEPGVRELTLRFAEPCALTVMVPGYADSPLRGSLRVQLVSEPEKLERGGISHHVIPESESAELLADGTAEFSNLGPGIRIAQLTLETNRYSQVTIAHARVDVRAAAQQVALPIPPLYDVVVRGPTLEPRTNLWVQQVHDEGENSGILRGHFQASGQLDEQRQATFTRMPAGRYRIHANGSMKALDIHVPGGPYVLEARVIDCCRVAISDEDGVLYRAGLRPGDLITSINGVPFTATNYWSVLREQGAKKGVPLTLIRNGKAMALQGGDHVWLGESVGGSFTPACREDL